MRRAPIVLAGIAVAAALVAAPPAWAKLTQTGVKVQPRPIAETTPAVSKSYFAWAQNSRAKPNTFNAYEQGMSGDMPSGKAFRVNASGTQGFGGGIASIRLAYQQVAANQSDIMFWNLVSHRRSPPPPGINTRSWEWQPTITSSWILFGRVTATRWNVILFNLSTHGVHLLASVPRNKAGTSDAVPGQVNGNYATWYACTPTTRCHVYLYDIAAHTTTVIPRAAGIYDTAPAVTSTGTLYFDRADGPCGQSAKLMKLPLGGAPTVLIAFHPGFDFFDLQTYRGGAGDQLFYDRTNCSRSFDDDIVKVVSP